MDQNQPADDTLQKAIDDITNNVDPVFSDPVAAPSSVPEGDTGELSAPVGPFPEADTKVDILPPAPEPMAPLEAANIPELNNLPPLEPTPEPTPVPEPTPEPTPAAEASGEPLSSDTKEIKNAALHELLPILDKTDADPEQKFNICKDALEDSKDQSALAPALKAAKEISDETKRAEALLYLVESIDKM